MSLAPSLLTTLATVIGLGSASISGLEPTLLTDKSQPSTSSLSVVGRAPTVTLSQGPVANPESSASLSLVDLIPSLKKLRIIYPTLPDAAGEENDLTPTLVENVINPTTPITPAVATFRGIAPSVLADDAQGIAPSKGLVTINGLAPTVSLLEWEVPERTPGRSLLELIPLDPYLVTRTVSAPNQMAASIGGLQPTLVIKYGWRTVELSGVSVWTDVPRV